MTKLLPLSFLIFLFGCDASPERIRHSLDLVENQGYTHVIQKESEGYDSLCGDSDNYEVHFLAISPTGKYTEGSVCSGENKGYTIRFK